MDSFICDIQFNQDGLVPVITQDNDTDEVLMLAYANAEALQKTAETGYAVYYSRSRRKIWCKGEESGNLQRVTDIMVDCDADALVYRVTQLGVGAACHTGHRSCFYRHLADGQWADNDNPVLFDPQNVYK